jgi:hypothetical protein
MHLTQLTLLDLFQREMGFNGGRECRHDFCPNKGGRLGLLSRQHVTSGPPRANYRCQRSEPTDTCSERKQSKEECLQSGAVNVECIDGLDQSFTKRGRKKITFIFLRHSSRLNFLTFGSTKSRPHSTIFLWDYCLDIIHLDKLGRVAR